MTIYSRTGDSGTTSLADGTRVRKDDVRIEVLGTLDELNAHVGMLMTLITDKEELSLLDKVQHHLFAIGAIMAYYPMEPPMYLCEKFSSNDILLLEKAIDAITSFLPPQTSFILPSGSSCACQAHICRTVCRRAERQLVSLITDQSFHLHSIQFLNRLSDYLFVLARKCNFCHGITEKRWTKYCK